MKYIKLFENFDKLKELCSQNLAYLLDDNFYYYIDNSDSPDYIRIELYKNDFDEDGVPNGFYWSEVSDAYEVLIDLLKEYNYIIEEIVIIYTDGQDNLINNEILNIKIDDDRLITDIKMYIKK